ncbi:MAG: VCBS repeat-containing protein, partial [Pirellulales bacterium]
SVIVTGEDIGSRSQPWITVVDPATGATLNRFLAYESGFRGGVRVALGDVVGDGTQQIITAPGPGRVGEIRVFRQDGTELVAYRSLPFGGRYRGGVEVAAGDFNGDRVDDIVAAASRGPGLVNVFLVTPGVGLLEAEGGAARPIPATPTHSLRAFPNRFMGGATVTTADVGSFSAGRLVDPAAADGRVELVVASGRGLPPSVLIYDLSGTPTIVRRLSPFAASMRGGLSVSAGRYDTDQIDDIIVTGGFRSGSQIEVHSGRVTVGQGGLLAKREAFASLATAGLPLSAAAITSTDGRVVSIAVVQGAGRGNGIRRLSITPSTASTLADLAGPLRIAATRPAFAGGT